MLDRRSPVRESPGTPTLQGDAGAGPPLAAESTSFYTRRATGLVRAISPGNALIMNLVFISIPLAALNFTVGPFAFRGVNLFWSIAITAFFALFPTFTYAFLASTMPRSGGDYVWVSRILHPSVGFASNVNLTASAVFFTGIMATWIAGFAASSALLSMGTVLRSHELVHLADVASRKETQLIVGLIAIAAIAAALAFSTRAGLMVTAVLFALSVLGIVPVLILLLTQSHADFVRAFNHFASYNGIFSLARRDAGFIPAAGFSLGATLAAMPLAYGSFGYGAISTYVSGEIKSARKSSFYTTLGSVIISGTLIAVLAGLSMHVFSSGFLGSITSLSGSKDYPLQSQPFFFLFVSMLTSSPVVLAIVAVGFVAGVIAVIPPTLLIATRNMLAWSLDRVMPTGLSSVNARTATPVKAIVAAAIVMAGFMTLFLYVPLHYWTTFVYVPGVMGLITFFIVCVCGTVFPWRRPDIYATSPFKRSVAGIPIISLVAVVGAVYDALLIVFFLTNKALGVNSTAGLVSIPVVFCVAFVWYFGARALQRSKGVDIELGQHELPPE